MYTLHKNTPSGGGQSSAEEVLVYFLDTLVEEVAEYSDCKITPK